jgi:cytochrome c oxidase assembly factor CtaG
MIQFLVAMFTVWELRWEVLIPMGVMLYLYLRGWFRLRAIQRRVDARRRRQRWRLNRRGEPLATPWRLASYLAGWGVLLVALISGIDAYGSMFFFVHMLQHLLIMMVAPPLLWLAQPYAIGMWGLPRRWRLEVGGLFADGAPLRRALGAIARPGLAWMVMVVVTWVWHDGSMYNLSLTSELIHDIQHLSFVFMGLYYWWLVIGAAPRHYRFSTPLRRSLYVLAAVPPNALLGLSIALAEEPIYTYYEAVPRLWGMSVMADQQLGGVLMWVPGSMMFMMAALISAAIYFIEEEKKKALPQSEWDGDNALLIPGFKAHEGG